MLYNKQLGKETTMPPAKKIQKEAILETAYELAKNCKGTSLFDAADLS